MNDKIIELSRYNVFVHRAVSLYRSGYYTWEQAMETLVIALCESSNSSDFDFGNYNDDFSPKCCAHCGGSEFTESTKDSLESHILEFEVVCKNCNKVCGYWAHGHYDPCFSDLSSTI